MHVVLNSDVLYGDYARHGIPSTVKRLLIACNERGHILTIPRTTLLEIERAEAEKRQAAIREIQNAYATLDRHQISHEGVKPEDQVAAVDLIELFSTANPEVVIADATLEEFQDAHDRACLHTDPHPPESKSDEMRDLVIWAIARRYALANGQALLVSRDAVHYHHRGDTEAASVGLVRVRSIGDALDYLEVATPGGELLRELISPSWSLLRNAGLPVGATESIRGMTEIEFVQGTNGPAEASGRLRIQGEENAVITAVAKIVIVPPERQGLTLSDISIDGERRESVHVAVLYSPPSADDMDERLASLHDLFGNGG